MGRDQQNIIQAELDHKDWYIQQLSDWYLRLDSKGSGEITLDEFMLHASDPEMLVFASTIGIDIIEMKQFFIALSANGRRRLDLETFVLGCIKLRGNAKSMDLWDLIYSHREMHQELAKFYSFCKQHFAVVEQEIASLKSSAAPWTDASSPDWSGRLCTLRQPSCSGGAARAKDQREVD